MAGQFSGRRPPGFSIRVEEFSPGIILLSRLGYGMGEQAVLATKAIKFQAAAIGGAPIPYLAVLEIGFNLS